MNTSNEYSSKKRYREEESVLTSSMSDADQQKQRNNRPVVRTKDQDDDTMNRVKKKQKDMNRSSTIALEESKLHLSDKELINIHELLQARQTARNDKNWKQADILRDQLKKIYNVIVKDSKVGPPVWAIGDDWKILMNVK